VENHGRQLHRTGIQGSDEADAPDRRMSELPVSTRCARVKRKPPIDRYCPFCHVLVLSTFPLDLYADMQAHVSRCPNAPTSPALPQPENLSPQVNGGLSNNEDV
jgi:hypothetical protein